MNFCSFQVICTINCKGSKLLIRYMFWNRGQIVIQVLLLIEYDLSFTLGKKLLRLPHWIEYFKMFQ